MGLSHLNFASETVSTPGGDFAVRGLNLEDITVIVRLHANAANALFEHIKSNGVGVSIDDNIGFLTGLAQRAPELAAQIICVGADEPDMSLARKLAFPVQLDALEKIAKLTFEAIGPGKVLETIIRVTKATATAIQALRA